MGKLSDLASQFKQAIDHEEARKKKEAEEEARRKEEAETRRKKVKKLRKELLDELKEFADALGHVEAKKKKGSVKLCYDDASITFEPDGDELLALIYEGHSDQDCVYLDSNEDWVVSREIGGQLHTQELVTDGLLTLMVEILGLPDPRQTGAATEPEPVAADEPTPPVPERASEAESESADDEQPRPGSGPGSAVQTLTNPWD